MPLVQLSFNPFVCQMLLFNFPLTLYLGRCLDMVISHEKHPVARRCPAPIHWFLLHGDFLVMELFQIWLAVGGFYKAYGKLALFLGPVRTWGVILAVYLRYIALKTPSRSSWPDDIPGGKPQKSKSEQNGPWTANS